MNNQIVDDVLIRSYLLGQIGAEDKLSTQFDEWMLSDPEFSQRMDVVEDEILEDYVDGLMSEADVEAVECHFLVPPERQHRLRANRLMIRRLQTAATAEPDIRLPQHGRLLVMPGTRAVGIAAGLALAVCTLYVLNSHREFGPGVKQNREESAQTKQVPVGKPLRVESSTAVALSLFEPGLSRGRQVRPEVHLTAGDETLHLSIALTDPFTAGRLSVRLQQNGAVAWSREGLEARLVPGGAVLAVDLPAAIVQQGVCQLVVSKPGPVELSYWFNASKTP